MVNPHIHQHALRGGPTLRKPTGSYPRYSRLDFNRVAECIRVAREQLKGSCDDRTANEIIWELAKMFKQDNPKFEELRFIAACSSTV